MGRFCMESHIQTWEDMLAQQEVGLYPQAFSKITNPVYMIHGKEDPHPGELIYGNLKQYISHLEYHELEKCGHSPWTEKFARADFYSLLQKIICE